MPLPYITAVEAVARMRHQASVAERNAARTAAHLAAIYQPEKLPKGAVILDPADWWMDGGADVIAGIAALNVGMADGDSYAAISEALDRAEAGIRAMRTALLGGQF